MLGRTFLEQTNLETEAQMNKQTKSRKEVGPALNKSSLFPPEKFLEIVFFCEFPFLFTPNLGTNTRTNKQRNKHTNKACFEQTDDKVTFRSGFPTKKIIIYLIKITL